jgi:chloramphenicol-sensitive protein RarD
MARSGGGDPQHTSAFIAAVASFATWGLVPIYWKLLSRVPALEILAHRFVWTIVFLGLLLSWQERWREVVGNLRRRRSALFCLGSGIMVGLNWLLFIWAVNIGHVLETSLGYFMTPIVNVLLGAIILRERLSAWQTASILIALVAVSILAFGYGHFPWIALGLCTSFGLYGLLRKQSGTAAIPGLFLETLFLLPLALVYLVILTNRGALTFGPSHLALSAILTTSGIVTAVPLIWFGYAARHLRLVTDWFSSISLAQHQFHSWAFCLSRDIHPPAFHYLSSHLVRACPCFSRSGFALARDQMGGRRSTTRFPANRARDLK